MSPAPHAAFADAFRAGARFVHPRDGELTIAVHPLGELSVRSGRLAACDPFDADWAARDDGFVRRVPTGRFPVELAIVCSLAQSARVAAARVRLADRPAVRWELARCDQGSAARSPTAGLDGYGVDQGVGCFYDPNTSALVDEPTRTAWLAAMHAGDERGWSAHLAPVGEGNVAMFSSGNDVGYGWYRSYWGLDEGGKTVELVTDFDLLVEDVEVRLSLPSARGVVEHPELVARGLVIRRGWWRRATLDRAPSSVARACIERSDGGQVVSTYRGGALRFRWPRLPVGVTLEIAIVVGQRALVAVG